jgi:4-amino-4-deoxy-L-arabinose transferase-like glycosyltransferase
LSQWANSYWGGALAAAAGCLVFGSLPRLQATGRARDAALLGAGLGLHMLIRQFESIFLILVVILYFLPALRKPLLKLAGIAALAALPALLLTFVQNKMVTGSWTQLPEALSQYQYGVPASLTFEAPQVPHRQLTRQQAMDYKMQLSFHQGAETIGSYFQRLEYRVRFYRFFFLPPLYLACIAFFWSLREYRFVWVACTLAIFALGTNFFPAFQIHYIAAVTCLFVLVAVAGLQQMSRLRIRGHSAGQEAAVLIAILCGAHFLFWYSMHLAEDNDFSLAARRLETWDSINHANPARRIFVAQELDKVPGQLLVFVRYLPQHIFQDEWVYNAADIDGSRIVWARDLGTGENEELLRYYPGRTALVLETDFQRPKLSEYRK